MLMICWWCVDDITWDIFVGTKFKLPGENGVKLAAFVLENYMCGDAFCRAKIDCKRWRCKDEHIFKMMSRWDWDVLLISRSAALELLQYNFCVPGCSSATPSMAPLSHMVRYTSHFLRHYDCFFGKSSSSFSKKNEISMFTTMFLKSWNLNCLQHVSYQYIKMLPSNHRPLPAPLGLGVDLCSPSRGRLGRKRWTDIFSRGLVRLDDDFRHFFHMKFG